MFRLRRWKACCRKWGGDSRFGVHGNSALFGEDIHEGNGLLTPRNEVFLCWWGMAAEVFSDESFEALRRVPSRAITLAQMKNLEKFRGLTLALRAETSLNKA